MRLHDLGPNEGSKKKKKRVGRGIAAGQGKTAGRGTKGEGARRAKGGSLYRQGGQLSLFRRLPFKRGFTNIRRVEFAEVNVDQLADFQPQQEVNPRTLAEAGLIRPGAVGVVLLGRGAVGMARNPIVDRSKSGRRSSTSTSGWLPQLTRRETWTTTSSSSGTPAAIRSTSRWPFLWRRCFRAWRACAQPIRCWR